LKSRANTGNPEIQRFVRRSHVKLKDHGREPPENG
jgi:hypothetical protein